MNTFKIGTVLTWLAGLVGIMIAYLFQILLLRLLPIGEFGVESPAIDRWTLIFAVLASIVTGLIVAIVPAIRGSSTTPHLRAGTRATEGASGTRLRSSLVVVQVAVSIVLLIGAGLLIRSMMQLSTVDLGFQPERLLSGRIQILSTDYPTPEQRYRFFTSLLEEVEALPGIESAGLINKLPILDPWQDWGVWPADRPEPSAEDGRSAMARWVQPGYFDTMGIPILNGRDISETDLPNTPRVIVISSSIARTFFPEGDSIGKQLKIWGVGTAEIVGVVGDARLNRIQNQPDWAMYMSYPQMGGTQMWLVAKTTGDPAAAAEPIRRILRRKDPNVLFASPSTMTSSIDNALADFRIIMASLALFAGIALLLTAIGIYGVLSYYVSQRRNEIGIRMALGASRGTLLTLVVRRGAFLASMGLLLGLATAYPASRLIRQILFETTPLDPAAYAGSVLFLGAVAFVACLLPAWRAIRISPIEALRVD